MSDMITDPQLFHLDPFLRWKKASEIRRSLGSSLITEIRAAFPSWPKYWWGAINPWLVFIGPSPGNSPGAEVNWEIERWPALGEPQMHFAQYRGGAGFWPRMGQWTQNAYGAAGIFSDDPEACLGSVLLANMIPTKQGDARAC